MAVFKDISLNNDSWELTAIFPAWEQNQTFENFIGAFKEVDGNYYLAVANYSDVQSQCYGHFYVSDIQAEELVFKDLFGKSEYIRNREQITQRGLYLDMPEYSYHLFKILDKPACRQGGSNYA
ncbi:MAG: hypothetical protein HYY56_01490 [Candidatus Omnitrophica bacterium]|nr:hypothetical protein [Candidatus Omnitrophota bacterium]